MVDEEGARDCGVGGGIEGAFEGGEEGGDVVVERADFSRHGADEVGLVGWEVVEGLGAFGVLDLLLVRLVELDKIECVGRESTSLLPSSPYIVEDCCWGCKVSW